MLFLYHTLFEICLLYDGSNILYDSMNHHIVHKHKLVSFYCNQQVQSSVEDTVKT